MCFLPIVPRIHFGISLFLISQRFLVFVFFKLNERIEKTSMKNKFKKSKIIVPALALITATTAASVTGTVAWFTATRAVTVTASNFVATKLESKLDVECKSGVGTTGSAKTVTVDGSLTHGSYDAKSKAEGSLYVAKINDTDTTVIDEYKDLGTVTDAVKQTATTTSNKWLARLSGSNKTWYGVSWTMSFTLEDETSGQTDYVCFDPNDSKFEDSSKKTTTTAPGIRIALMTSTQCIVLGNDATVTHTNGTTSSSTGYFGTEYIDLSKGTTVTKETDDSTTLTTSKYNLGIVTKDIALDVTCVAWYEGSDSYVADTYTASGTETTIDMSSIKATLNFYTRYIRA
jgi:hypothetical protein